LEDRDLAYLTEGTESFDAYVEDMDWAQRYALTNREFMMDAVLDQVFRFVGQGTEVQRINCHHNFTRREEHYGETVWLTRKGAIFAGVGALGVVPGSMGAATYITSGLGNPASYSSSAHGAGRQRSRGAAKRELDLEGEQGLREYMAGVAWNVEDAKALMDEHPLAYKDIDQVMEDQKDLCRPIHKLRQILNYKGT
jgi:tRNA-splicing ligase RtcB